MQQTGHNLGHSKHRKAFGKPDRTKALKILERDYNRMLAERVETRRRQRGNMYRSIKELMKKENF